MGMGDGTRAALGDGGILISPRGAGAQAEQEEGRSSFLFILSLILKLNLVILSFEHFEVVQVTVAVAQSLPHQTLSIFSLYISKQVSCEGRLNLPAVGSKYRSSLSS